MTSKVKVAIIGSGNIGTDLMIKVIRLSDILTMAAFVGVDPKSDGLERARLLKVPTSAGGVDGLVAMAAFEDIEIVFDATSAEVHRGHAALLRSHGKRLIDLTPAGLGPYVVPPVNGHEHLDAPDVNMVTCGGQATIPMVAAVSRVTPVHYAEVIASIASKSAGPGTRANIDEFTETTAEAVEEVGGARRGKAIIILNPAEPPMVMRDTVYCLTDEADRDAIRASVAAMLEEVRGYVPGYRLAQPVQFERVGGDHPLHIPEMQEGFTGLKVTIFIEVRGAAHYLPAHAGNLDIMTSAALRTAERIAQRMHPEVSA